MEDDGDDLVQEIARRCSPDATVTSSTDGSGQQDGTRAQTSLQVPRCAGRRSSAAITVCKSTPWAYRSLRLCPLVSPYLLIFVQRICTRHGPAVGL